VIVVAAASFVEPVAPFAVVAAYTTAGVLMVRNGRRLSGREAGAWRTIGWALLLAVAGMVAVAVASSLDPDLPTFSGFDLVFLSSYVVAGIGIARLPQQSERGGSGLRTFLDGLVGAVSGAALLWVYVADDIVESFREADPWSRAIGSLTVIADMSLLVVVVIVLVRRSSRRFDPRLISLSIGLAFQALGNVIFLTSGVATALTRSAEPYPVFALAGLCAAGAGMLLGRESRASEYPEDSPPLWALFAPYSIAGVLAVAAVAESVGGGRMSSAGGVLTVAATLVVGLTITRQALAIRANAVRVESERRRLVASVSHELRTPLTGVVGFLEILSDPSLPEPERREMHALALDQARVLGRIVEDLIQLSRDSLHEAPLERCDVSVYELAGEVAHMAGPGTITLDVPRGLRANLDRGRMTQALAHLVGNALRYGEGRADLVVVARGSELVVEVHDDGPGVPRRFEKVVWERFERGAHALDAANPGSGIGLTFVYAIARAHGGDASYRRSERLGGACFVIRIPEAVLLPVGGGLLSGDLH